MLKGTTWLTQCKALCRTTQTRRGDRRPERYDVSTPDRAGTPDEFHSPIARSPPPAAAASSSPPPAAAASLQPPSDDRISRLENLFSSSLSALMDRLDAVTAKPISRPARRGSRKSPTRARGEALASDAREAAAPGVAAETTNAATKPPAFNAGIPSKHGAPSPGRRAASLQLGTCRDATPLLRKLRCHTGPKRGILLEVRATPHRDSHAS